MENCYVVAVAGIFLNEQNEVLIAKRIPKPDFPIDIWEFPSGRLEPNETLEACLRREMKEELNLNISQYELFHVYNFYRGEAPAVLINYICNSDNLQNIKVVEHSELKWVKISKLKLYFTLPKQLEIMKLLSKNVS